MSHNFNSNVIIYDEGNRSYRYVAIYYHTEHFKTLHNTRGTMTENGMSLSQEHYHTVSEMPLFDLEIPKKYYIDHFDLHILLFIRNLLYEESFMMWLLSQN